MRNAVWFLAIVGVLFSVAVHIESYSAERKVSADMMNITSNVSPSKQSFKSEMTPTFATNHIYGSDASISTYGLNHRRSTDW